MKALSDLLLPRRDDNTLLSVDISAIEKQSGIKTNIYYQVIDETTLQVKKLISIQILLLCDNTGEYFFIVDESSTADRWRSPQNMHDYFNMRKANLNEIKKSIFLTGEYDEDDHCWIQYYVYVGKSRFEHIVKLIKKVIGQIDLFRTEYINNANEQDDMV
jgi:hypothetical protein